MLSSQKKSREQLYGKITKELLDKSKKCVQTSEGSIIMDRNHVTEQLDNIFPEDKKNDATNGAAEYINSVKTSMIHVRHNNSTTNKISRNNISIIYHKPNKKIYSGSKTSKRSKKIRTSKTRKVQTKNKSKKKKYYHKKNINYSSHNANYSHLNQKLMKLKQKRS